MINPNDNKKTVINAIGVPDVIDIDLIEDDSVYNLGIKNLSLNLEDETLDSYLIHADGRNFTHLVLQKGAYLSNYMLIDTSGVPDGAIVNLVDANNNPLYSPFDANTHYNKTQCSVVIGGNNIIPLPADYITDTEWRDFEPGVYYWKLQFIDEHWEELESRLLKIEIRDFNLFEPILSTYYPNEILQIKIRNYEGDIDESILNNCFNTNIDLDNATYDPETGILTLPDANKNVGVHSLFLDTYFIPYEVKNPISFHTPTYIISYNPYDTLCNIIIGYVSLTGDQTGIVDGEINTFALKINGIPQNDFYIDWSDNLCEGYISRKPPGTYYCEVTGSTTTCPELYTCKGTIKITTDNCSISLAMNVSGNLVATYLYDESIPIPNATLEIQKQDGTVVFIGKTNSDGQVIINNPDGIYIARVLDSYTDEVLLISDEYRIPRYIDNIQIVDGNLIAHIISLSNINNTELVSDISINNGVLSIDTITASDFLDTKGAIIDIDIDENKNIIIYK